MAVFSNITMIAYKDSHYKRSLHFKCNQTSKHTLLNITLVKSTHITKYTPMFTGDLLDDPDLNFAQMHHVLTERNPDIHQG